MLRKSHGSSSTVHLFYVPEIDISSFLQALIQRSRLFCDSHGLKISNIGWQNNGRTMQHTVDSKRQFL